ncbi:MAG TPA: hypothetical protein PLP19_06145 [bacterium]|nr:hypothetical protein [bacterium]HPN43049.1 hypothetical protein [bacterium]
MKKIFILIVGLLLIAGTTSFAQKDVDVQVTSNACNAHKVVVMGDGGCCPGLELSEKQQKDFKIARLENDKAKLIWKNKLEAKNLDFSAELLKDNPDLSTLNAIVDETAKFQAELKKLDLALKFKQRAMLTDEQKKIWDKTEGCLCLDMPGCCMNSGLCSDGMMKKMIWISKDTEDETDLLHAVPEKHIEKRIEIK